MKRSVQNPDGTVPVLYRMAAQKPVVGAKLYFRQSLASPKSQEPALFLKYPNMSQAGHCQDSLAFFLAAPVTPGLSKQMRKGLIIMKQMATLNKSRIQHTNIYFHSSILWPSNSCLADPALP